MSRSEAVELSASLKDEGKTVVFTNGCFDILHVGHISSLEEAAQQGDFLIVGVNADLSVQRLKGPHRPVNNQEARATVLAALQVVDAVVVFEEDTPKELITALMPQVLVKGGDYKPEDIAGAAEVIAAGGRVHINNLIGGFSTTSLIERLKAGA